MEYGNGISRLIGRRINETMIHTLTLLTVLRLLRFGFCILHFLSRKKLDTKMTKFAKKHAKLMSFGLNVEIDVENQMVSMIFNPAKTKK